MIDKDKISADRMKISDASSRSSVEIKASNRQSNNVSGNDNVISSAKSPASVEATIIRIVGEIAITQVACPISKGRHGAKGKTNPGANAKLTFVAATTIGGGNGSSAVSICNKCAA